MNGSWTSISSNNITRWNPTKDQISILEGLYGQGMRAPTSDQIYRITSRLREYGHIEGKNVFYWFQNHKARQRQKEKDLQHQQQQSSCLSFSYMNHRCLYFHNCSTTAAGLYRTEPPPSSTNVVFRPYAEQNETAGDIPALNAGVLPSGSNMRMRIADANDHEDKLKLSLTMQLLENCHTPNCDH